MPKVFISYSHESEAHRELILQLSNRLRHEGVDCFIDRYVNGFPKEGWINWMRNQIEDADYVLVVCTETYKRRFQGKDTNAGRGVTFEGAVINQTLYQNFQQNEKFIPLLPDDGSYDHVPVELQASGAFKLGKEYETLYRFLTDQPEIQMPELGEIRKLGLMAENQDANPRTNQKEALPELQAYELVNTRPIVIDQLPTVPGDFFGREDELKMLNTAHKHLEAGADNAKTIIPFIAPGGTGKTKLLRHWLDYNLALFPNRIIWSFYSQGTTDARQVSASPLLIEAFKAFGVDPNQYSTDEDKADALYDLLVEHKCLLVLDGLEPMQHAGKGMDGQLKDRAIKRLLNKLCGQNRVLCVITTRIPVHELKNRATVISHDLNNLCTEDGVKLLRSHQVQGRDEQLEKLVKKVQGHALTLHLIGIAIHSQADNEALKLDTLSEWFDEDQTTGQHAFKVMRFYEEWLRDENDQPLPELQLLYMLGLFDHPIEKKVLQVLWDEQIPGLSSGITLRQWKTAITKLKDTHRLLSQHAEDANLLDCHPLIREYFGKQLEEKQPEAWQNAHTRLYELYKNLPQKELPDTVEEMRPLFAAVAHGCAAGLHQQALDEVYWPRIKRKGEHYLTKKLGAYSDDLAVVAHFFAEPWSSPALSLSPEDKALVLNLAGLRLRALGRLREALEPVQAGIEMSVEQDDWKGAAQDVGNLSELQVTLGDIQDAVKSAEQSVAFADRSENKFQQMGKRTTYADALHQAGRVDQALALFQEAEQLQKEDQPEYPRLYSLLGFRYCDLLLALAGENRNRVEEVLSRAEQTLSWAKQQGTLLLTIAMDQLTLARAHLQQHNHEQAADWLEQAVAGLRAAGTMDQLPLGLLTRATLHRLNHNFPKAQQDLQEVYEIAEASSMRLHLCDYHLEIAQLTHAQCQQTETKVQPTIEAHLKQAEELIKQCGYHRRDGLLAELQSKLLNKNSARKLKSTLMKTPN